MDSQLQRRQVTLVGRAADLEKRMSVDRPVDPPKLVEVRYRGLWVSGQLVAWRKDGDRWLGFCELQVLRGGHWFDQDDIRPCG